MYLDVILPNSPLIIILELKYKSNDEFKTIVHVCFIISY